MADSDPDLAATLLAAFSAPTGALPVSDLSSLSNEGWHWDSIDGNGTDLLSGLKAESQSEPASGPEPLIQAHIPPESSPEQPPKQEPLQPRPYEQEAPRQETAQQQQGNQSQEPSQEPPQEPSQQGPAAQEPSQQGSLPQATLPEEVTTPQLHLPHAPSQHEHQPQPLAVPELPQSPQKRPRSRTPEADKHGSIAEKRLKTDHHDLVQRDVDLSAANWDISAMIENALGSFDQQSHQPHEQHNRGEGENSGAVNAQSKPVPPRKAEQRRMKFSSNPYYVMRTMSLPLLGSLVSQLQAPWPFSLLWLIIPCAGHPNTARTFPAVPRRDSGAHGRSRVGVSQGL